MESENDKTYNSIPTSKVQRAMKVMGTGVKIGGNYVAHYSKNLFKEQSKEALHEKNAETVFEALGEMKGSALKMAQMLSMDEFTLPESYQKVFQQAQHNAPPLSFPLIQKTFRSQLKKDIPELFDTFSRDAIHAASIGQVHLATKNGHRYAVKVQYPGVADSIASDIRLMRPLAQKVLNVSQKELDFYVSEVQATLMEETDYLHELEMAQIFKASCSAIPHLHIPAYHKELSSERVLTMDWVDGTLLTEWLESKPADEQKAQVAQTIWDTFLFQMQELRLVHADPHPGNFIIREDGTLCLIDFGCVKRIEPEFYQRFFRLLNAEVLNDPALFHAALEDLDFFNESDSEEDQRYLFESLQYSIKLLAEPFQSDSFNFGAWDYMKGIYNQGEDLAKEIRKRKINSARGPREAIYLLRTFYGLYMILAKIGQPVKLNYPLKTD
jgi:predicted unusual protein kinase regulating ubiquinone biosynthesis (AarF/ABC1/UbiB family)